MPAAADEGSLDFIVDDAYVGNVVLTHPVLTDLITVRAHNVRGHACRPGVGRSSLPLLEALPRITLQLRKPIRKEEGAAVGMAFIGLEIEESEHTLHLGLQPDDIRLLVALWLDNLSRNFKPPEDGTKKPLPPETVALSVHVNVSQAANQPATPGPLRACIYRAHTARAPRAHHARTTRAPTHAPTRVPRTPHARRRWSSGCTRARPRRRCCACKCSTRSSVSPRTWWA